MALTDDPFFSDAAAIYLNYLDLAKESLVEFSTETLKLTGFNERCTAISTNCTIPLIACGTSNHIAWPDACLLHRQTFILMMLSCDNTSPAMLNIEDWIIAEAIAAFQYNNQLCTHLGLEPLYSMTIPCIAMIHTHPFFYLVPVTTELSHAVMAGQHPATKT